MLGRSRKRWPSIGPIWCQRLALVGWRACIITRTRCKGQEVIQRWHNGCAASVMLFYHCANAAFTYFTCLRFLQNYFCRLAGQVLPSKHHVDSMTAQCWSNVYDGGPPLTQLCFIMLRCCLDNVPLSFTSVCRPVQTTAYIISTSVCRPVQTTAYIISRIKQTKKTPEADDAPLWHSAVQSWLPQLTNILLTFSLPYMTEISVVIRQWT